MDHMPIADSAVLTAQDYAILDNVESALAKGRALKQWWEQTNASNSYAERFETVCAFNRPDHSFAFFDEAPLREQPLPVMGDVMDLFYDRPKSSMASGAAEVMQEQMREFILRYFMRISDFRRPQAYAKTDHPVPSPMLRPFSWCPTTDPSREGFGYAQFYYKRRDSGQVGKFPAEERFAIVDVRELLDTYEWIVMRIRIFDFNLTFSPFGNDYPQIDIPLREHQWVVMSRDFIVVEDNPDADVLGRYGYGYAVVKNPADQGLVAYGPGQFDEGFQLFHFRVLATGEARAQLVFVVNRPERLLNAPLNPVTWGLNLADVMSCGLSSQLLAPAQRMLQQASGMSQGFDPVLGSLDLLNTFTGGLAARTLCMSRQDLEKDMLVQHFMQNYDLIVGSLLTWRQIPNWLDSAALPHWAMTGMSS